MPWNALEGCIEVAMRIVVVMLTPLTISGWLCFWHSRQKASKQATAFNELRQAARVVAQGLNAAADIEERHGNGRPNRDSITGIAGTT